MTPTGDGYCFHPHDNERARPHTMLKGGVVTHLCVECYAEELAREAQAMERRRRMIQDKWPEW